MIATKVKELSNLVKDINQLMSELHNSNVEVRIAYKEAAKGEPPRVDLWRVIEHIDHLKKDTENE